MNEITFMDLRSFEEHMDANFPVNQRCYYRWFSDVVVARGPMSVKELLQAFCIDPAAYNQAALLIYLKESCEAITPEMPCEFDELQDYYQLRKTIEILEGRRCH